MSSPLLSNMDPGLNKTGTIPGLTEFKSRREDMPPTKGSKEDKCSRWLWAWRWEKLIEEHQRRPPGGGNICDLKHYEAKIEGREFSPRVQYVSFSWGMRSHIIFESLGNEQFLWMRWAKEESNSEWDRGSVMIRCACQILHLTICLRAQLCPQWFRADFWASLPGSHFLSLSSICSESDFIPLSLSFPSMAVKTIKSAGASKY